MTTFSSLYTTYLTHELGTEDSTNLFTDTRRKIALKQGIQQFCDLTECLARTVTLTVTSTAFEYDLNANPGDFSRLAANQSVVFQYTNASSQTTTLAGHDDLPQWTVANLDQYDNGWRDSSVSTSMQLPSKWYLRPDGSALWLGFTPPPSSGSSASMLTKVPYVPFVNNISTTLEPFNYNSSVRADLRPYHMAPVHFAAHQLEKLRRDDQASDRQLQKFMGYVQRYTQAMRQKGGTTLKSSRLYFRRSLSADTKPQDPRT
jgi:hypothetical protein